MSGSNDAPGGGAAREGRVRHDRVQLTEPGAGTGEQVPDQTATLFTHGIDEDIRNLVLATDWAATPLGPVSTWSESLRAAVGICLNNPFPMLVMWGPELVMVYNAGYAPILGDKHPAAMGRPCAEVWAELWPVLRDRLEGVLAGTPDGRLENGLPEALQAAVTMTRDATRGRCGCAPS